MQQIEAVEEEFKKELDEVRKLAEKTASSTKQINEMLQENNRLSEKIAGKN